MDTTRDNERHQRLASPIESAAVGSTLRGARDASFGGMVIVPDRLRLPLFFDTPSLATEALDLAPSVWVPHFNRDVYEGEWTGVAFRSPGGVGTQLYPDPAPTAPFADTNPSPMSRAPPRSLADRVPDHGRPSPCAGIGRRAEGTPGLPSRMGRRRDPSYIPIVTADGVTFTRARRPHRRTHGR